MKTNAAIEESDRLRAARAKKATWIGLVVNVILSTAKIVAGIVGLSGAMIADGVHSISDSVTDIIVLIFIGLSAKGENAKYRYGHGKFETFATMLISAALIAVAIGIFVASTKQIGYALHGHLLPRPTLTALIMALVSIATKEWLFRYTRVVGEHIDSMALVANAWHHRSDAFSSIAVFIGIGCAMFLGEQWRILDPIAAAIVSLFIAMVGYRLIMPSIKELLEVSLPESETEEIAREIGKTEGVMAYHPEKRQCIHHGFPHQSRPDADRCRSPQNRRQCRKRIESEVREADHRQHSYRAVSGRTYRRQQVVRRLKPVSKQRFNSL